MGRLLSYAALCAVWLPFTAAADGPLSCTAPCVNLYRMSGNGVPDTSPATMSLTAGNVIIVTTRGGSGSTSSTVVNGATNPATLSWSLIARVSPGSPATDWVHDLYCAQVATSGSYTFHTTNNSTAAVGLKSGRSIATQITGVGNCASIQSKHGGSFGVNLTSGNLVVNQPSYLLAYYAIDSDLDNTGPINGTGGWNLYNRPDGNAGIEPDQKLIVGDLGVQPAGTYAATATISSTNESWSIWLLALPTGSVAPDTTTPAAPQSLHVS